MSEPVLVLADPRPGTAAQALGVAERLGLPFRVLPLEWGPLARLPWPFPTRLGLAPAARAALDASPTPRLVLSAGRRSAPVARHLARRGARTVHLTRPGFGASGFDLLVIGSHDAPRPAPNLLEILGACHRLSPGRLAEARAASPELAALPRPLVALLVGGPVRGEGLAPAVAAALLPRTLRHLPGATLLVTTSRRTGEAATRALSGSFPPGPHRLHRWGGAGSNPYAAFLAHADAVVATADSVSMLSEALATGAPLLLATEETGRHARLAQALLAAGRARRLEDAAAAGPRPPLDETGRVAEAIRERGLA